MTTSYLTRTLVAVAATVAFVPAANAVPTANSVSSVPFVTGGIGDEERDAIEAARKDYNLSIESAAQSGAYVGDTRVVVSDRQGQELLDTHGGPLFLAQLPPGRYIVEGSSGGQSQRKDISVSENGSAHVHFSWK